MSQCRRVLTSCAILFFDINAQSVVDVYLFVSREYDMNRGKHRNTWSTYEKGDFTPRKKNIDKESFTLTVYSFPTSTGT